MYKVKLIEDCTQIHFLVFLNLKSYSFDDAILCIKLRRTNESSVEGKNGPNVIHWNATFDGIRCNKYCKELTGDPG